MSTTEAGPQTAQRRKYPPGWVVFVVLMVVGVWGVRRWALAAAVGATVRTAQGISDGLPEARDRNLPPGEDLLFPLWPLSPGITLPVQSPKSEGQESSPAAQKAGPKAKRGVVPPLGPPPVSARASVTQVLSWVEHQIVPQGITRPAGFGMPAGIELHDVGGLGLGLLPGDRLITVDGISVLERSQVIGAVLGARSRRAETMTAGLMRRTKDGPVAFTVVVEQPYPEDVPDSVSVSDSAP